MSRRSRSAQRKNQEFFGGASPHIKRSIPFFDLPDEEQLETLEDQVDWLIENIGIAFRDDPACLLYTSPSPRDRQKSRMPSSA